MSLQNEPAQVIAYITAAVSAALALLVAFGVSLTPDQQTAVLGAAAVLAPIAAGIIIRQNVYSPDTTRDIQIEAWHAGAPPTEDIPTLPNPPGDNASQQETSKEGVQRFTNVRH